MAGSHQVRGDCHVALGHRLSSGDHSPDTPLAVQSAVGHALPNTRERSGVTLKIDKSIREEDLKKMIDNIAQTFENSKNKVINIDIELSLEECQAISNLLQIMRKKKPLFKL